MKAAQRLEFLEARDRGLTITAACKQVGVSQMTGTRWNRMRAKELQLLDRGKRPPLPVTRQQLLDHVLSKQETALYVSTAFVRACQLEQYAYVASLGALLSKMMGYDAPTEVLIHDVAREKLADYLIGRLEQRLTGNVPREAQAQLCANTGESPSGSGSSDYVNSVNVEAAEVRGVQEGEIPPSEGGGGGV